VNKDLYIISPIESRIWAFDCYRNRWSWTAYSGHYLALLHDCSFN